MKRFSKPTKTPFKKSEHSINHANANEYRIWFIADVARFLGVSEGHIYNLKSKGKIPCYKPGKRLYFFPEEILEWVHLNGINRRRGK